MNKKPTKVKGISRRRILPVLGSSLLIPFLGWSKPLDELSSIPEDEEYQTLLKPDGTTVKVKSSALKRSKILKKNVSNRSFLSWLGKKI